MVGSCRTSLNGSDAPATARRAERESRLPPEREACSTRHERKGRKEGPPLLLRLFGRGEVFEPGDEVFEALLARFPRYPGTRSIIRVSVTRIADSCGFGVPLYRFEGERTQLTAWAERKGEEGLREYQLGNNRVSLDGLPALRGEDF